MGTNFQYSKTLAMEGSILLILGLVPYVGWVLGIIGVILLLRGMKEFANYYQDNSIYQNALTGVKFYIIALIALAVAGAGFVIAFLPTAGFTISVNSINIVGLVVGVISLVVAFAFYVLAALHLRKTFDTLAQKSGEHSFATAATLLWVGSLLTIIAVGVLFIFIAWIFAVIGFFTIKPPQQEPYGYTPPPAQPMTQPQQTERYCPNCGSPVAPDATYCSHCGKQLTS
jgi:uncharacterized membrane protein